MLQTNIIRIERPIRQVVEQILAHADTATGLHHFGLRGYTPEDFPIIAVSHDEPETLRNDKFMVVYMCHVEAGEAAEPDDPFYLNGRTAIADFWQSGCETEIQWREEWKDDRWAKPGYEALERLLHQDP
ncbi:MAG: hypothetical protein ABH879_10460 [archaeon]